MANLKHAPLVYTLGMFQFPRIPDIGRFADKFLDRIRGDYPLSDCVSMPIVSAEFGTQGLQISQQDSKLWQFLSIDKNWGFILNENSLCLHTVQYHDFPDFATRFKSGITALLGIEDIGIRWVTALGMRYIDMVVPGENALQNLLQPWLLPAVLPESNMIILDGAYITRYQTDLGELRLQAMRNPPFTLPPELQNPLIAKNGWAKERPSNEFAIVDTDHGITYSDPKVIDITEIMASLDGLHLASKKVFESMSTSLAAKMWGDEK